MLKHLIIQDFAIIKNCEVSFEEGLNIITGETGAGKSIVISAMSLALGSRADSSTIRTGSSKAIVQLLGQLNGEDISIYREITQTGKNLCKLNGEIVTLATLNKTVSQLADIHGQYDNQSLLNPEYHIELVDKYKNDEIQPLLLKVASVYEEFSEVKAKLIKLLNTERDNSRKKDFLKFELDEISKTNLVIGEDEDLESKIKFQKNGEKIFSATHTAYEALVESEYSVLNGLISIQNALKNITSYSSEIESIFNNINEAYYNLEDVSSLLHNLREQTDFNPLELDENILRLSQIDNLKKKYGETIADVLSYKESLSIKLNQIENFSEEKKSLETKLLAIKDVLWAECKNLTAKRMEVSRELETLIENELKELNFKNAKIKINITPLKQPTPLGMDNVEILISTNKGEDLKPLYKVASGGEMSRIMLAFKNVISSYDLIPTLIFDEVDSGISGITASIVGQKLKKIASQHQIICITHLPQIAALGDYNYKIEKHVDDESTFTNITQLSEDEKVLEIARLLGGATITENTIINAKELISGHN